MYIIEDYENSLSARAQCVGGGASKDTTPIKAHLNRFQGEDTEKQNYGESTVLVSATRTSMRRIAPF